MCPSDKTDLPDIFEQDQQDGDFSMPKTPRSSSGDNIEPQLIVPRDKASEQLSHRIMEGEKLVDLSSSITNDYMLKSLRDDYYSWDEFNNELLGRIFSTEKYRNEYAGGALFSTLRDMSFSERIDKLVSDIRAKIRKIRSISDRLDIIPESIETMINSSVNPSQNKSNDRRVFIVHGRNEQVKVNVARFIERAGLEAIILHEQANKGTATVIDKLEANTGVGFAIVILTGDDEGKLKSDSINSTPRARQNVVFEWGYLIGKLGRSRVMALYEPGVDIPSDLGGVTYTLIDAQGTWRNEVARELDAAGIEFNHKALFSN